MSGRGYDRQITVFSPSGHLFQSEYAFKAVNASGLTSVGVRGTDSAVVVTQKKIVDKLVDPASVTHMFQITPKLGCVMTGLMSDCRAVVTKAREEAVNFHYKYGYSIPCSFLAQRVGDMAQVNTQFAGRRAMAVVVMFCSIDDEKGPQLFRVDPSGTVVSFRGASAGVKEQEAMSLLERKLKDPLEALNEDQTIQAAIHVLQVCLSSDFKASEIDLD